MLKDLVKEMFYVEKEEGKYRISLTKAGGNIQIISGVVGTAATTQMATNNMEIAKILGGLAAALYVVGKGLSEIGKRNVM